MQIKCTTVIILSCILAACQPQDHAVQTNSAASATAAATATPTTQAIPANASVHKNIQAALDKAYPEQQVQIKSVTATPVAGLYEVVVFPKQLVYMDASGEHMILGNLLEVKTQKNLTEERMSALNSVDYQALPFDAAIKEVRGNGQYKVAVFSDPDCPFCKRLEQEIAKLNDVTVYTFLMPIESLHPGATAKSEQFWCQTNRTEAWTKWMRAGVAPQSVPSCDNPVAKLVTLSEGLGFNGTPTIVYPNGKVQAGFLPKDAFEAALKANQS